MENRLNRLNRKLVLFFFFFCLFTQGITAQEVRLDSLSQQAYSSILALRLPEAEQFLQIERKRIPQNVYVDYLENYLQFIQSFISEDKHVFEEANAGFNKRYQRVSTLADNSPFKQFLLANMNLQWAFARLKFGQYVSAAYEINKAYRQLSANAEKFPNFVPDNISLGILHILIGLVPDQYAWLMRIISMQGSVEQGKAEIYSVLQTSLNHAKYAYLQHEAVFYLGFVELNLSPDQSKLKQLMTYLNKLDKGNLLLSYLKIDILMRHGKNDAALQALNDIPNSKAYYPFYYLDYLKGECLLRKLDPRAELHYAYFLHHFKGNNYVKDAWRKRAWTALLQSDTAKYYLFMDSLTSQGALEVDADKEAQEEAIQSKLPNTSLLRARLYFDGGYYAAAKIVLDSMNMAQLTLEGKVERMYRYARIAHKLHHWEQAKVLYVNTLKSGKSLTRYFAANAALKLGQIYEVQDSLEQAGKYYSLCLDLNFTEYRNSIRGKAKEALSRIQKKQ